MQIVVNNMRLQWDAEQWSSSDWELLLYTSSSGAVSSLTSYKSASSHKSVNLSMFLHLCNRAGEVDWGSEFSTTSADVTVEKVINQTYWLWVELQSNMWLSQPI